MGLRFVREVQKYLEFNLNYPNSFELIEKLIQLESVMFYILFYKS